MVASPLSPVVLSLPSFPVVATPSKVTAFGYVTAPSPLTPTVMPPPTCSAKKAVPQLTDHAEDSNIFGKVFEAFAFAR
jgi:hypothetical protein